MQTLPACSGRPGLPALAVLAAALACAAPAPAAAADGLDRALARGELTEAQHTLERARALFEPARARRLWGSVERPGPRAGTPILRELALRAGELRPTERARAERLLARPTSGRDPVVRYGSPAKRKCDPKLCFWWVRKGVHAPSLVDRNRNGVPDWVDSVRKVFAHVWATEVGRFGYRAPRSDLGARDPGPNGKLDIYVADIGRYGLYGYCTSDDRRLASRRSVSAYCVVDDDYARRQFPHGAAGLAALRVTAAHEFFHAVQFAYDWKEDLWLMEGTATWIEDEVFDRVNDNRLFLATSPLTRFWRPLDYYSRNPSHPDSGLQYGAWIFFRYLSERFGRGVVRDVWRRADGSSGAPNDYSIKAVRTIVERREPFADAFARFGVWNLYPRHHYSEGAAYPSPTPTSTTPLDPSGLMRTRVFLHHLSSDYHRFLPGTLPPEATATFTVELPEEAVGPRASAVAEDPSGALTVIPAAPDSGSGHWTIEVPGFAAYSRVTLVLTNAGTRYTCRQGEVFSCGGTPLDGREFHFSVDVS